MLTFGIPVPEIATLFDNHQTVTYSNPRYWGARVYPYIRILFSRNLVVTSFIRYPAVIYVDWFMYWIEMSSPSERDFSGRVIEIVKRMKVYCYCRTKHSILRRVWWIGLSWNENMVPWKFESRYPVVGSGVYCFEFSTLELLRYFWQSSTGCRSKI